MNEMDQPQRKRLFHDVPFWVSEGALFFITVNCKERGREQLTRPEISLELLSAAQEYHHQGKWYLDLFLLMPDHLHALAAFPREASMSKRVRDWKRFTSRRLGFKWQDGFFDHRLRGGREAELKHDYIRNNPVRKGLCESPTRWPYQLHTNEDGGLIGPW